MYLSDIFTKNSRDLMMSRLMRRPYASMRRIVKELISGDDKKGLFNDLKYIIYSAHDTQVDNLMVWLTQTKEIFNNIPYASTVVFELKYSPSCLE